MTLSPREHGHSRAEIARRLRKGPKPSYLRDWVYGAIDGVVTTFAVVCGVVGAELETRIVLILGVANLLADGFSMAAANYAGSRAEKDEYAQLREMEERHIDQFPDGEREEIRQILEAKGFEGETLEKGVAVITADRERWIAMMMADEHGVAPIDRSALKAALSTFAAFVLCGAAPLIPFALGLPASVEISTASAALAFFVVGSLRSQWSPSPFWRTGLETTAIGLVAAGIAYLIGAGLAALGA